MRRCSGTVLLLLFLGCQDPTQVRLHVRTDVPYEPNRMLSFVAATPERMATAAPDVVVDKPWGGRGDVGTLVVVPEGEKNGRLAIRVVMGVAKDPTQCTAEQPDGCVVTRRLLRFVEHRSVELPIGLHAICEGVSCDESSTCNALGDCVSAEIDPNRCEDPTDPGCLPGGDLIPIGVPEAGPDTEPEAGVDCTGYEPAMVEMPEGFCIDATEVTRAQYQQWLSTSPPTSGQPSECSWNDSYVPSCEWPVGAKESHPVVCVDWCDAYAYCKGVGKRLCGKIGGGENGRDDYADATKSEWYAACSSGGTHVYAYGDVFSETVCNGLQAGHGGTVPVGSLAGCQSFETGYAGVFDMIGNVFEWENSCTARTGPTDFCHVRGGSFHVGGGPCETIGDGDEDRNQRSYWLGIRCCS